MTTATWKTGTSGDWSTAADWTPNAIPGASTDVTIAAGGSYTVTVSSSEAAHSLLLDDAGATLQLDATLSIGTSFAADAGVISIATGETFSLAGAVSFGVNDHAGPTLLGPGTLHTSGAVSVAAQTGYDYIDLYVAGDGAWSNSGDVTDAGQIIFGNGYAQSNVFDLINQAGGVFDLTTDYAAINEDNSDTASFNNAGLLEKTGGTATSTIETAITQTSTGTIAVTSGTLEFTDGGSLAGHITTSGTGILAMANGSFTLASASVAADLLIDGGAVTITTPTALSGALTETSGTLAVTASSSESGPVALEVGVISIATGETFSLAGAVSFGVNDHAGPTLLGPGTLHTSGAVSVAAQTGYDYIDLYVAGDGAWSNSGDVTDAGQIIFGNGYAQSNVFDLINQAGGVFDLTTDYAAINEDNSDTASFNNAGLLEKTGGTATSTIETAITQASTGTIAVTSGTLEFTDGGSLAGHITTSGTGILAMANGSFTLASASVAADLLIDGGAVTITTPTALSGALTETSGTLAVTASSSESGPVALEVGVISIATGETFSLAGAVSFGVNDHAGPTLLGPGTLHTSGAVSVAAQTGYDYIDLYVAGDGAWSNSGDVTDAGQIIFGNGYAQSNVFDLINQAGGVFDLTTDYAAINEDNSDTASFNNAGLLEKTGGTATSTIETAITQASTGTIAVTSGTLEFTDGGSLAGHITTSGTGILAMANGSFTLASASVAADLLIDGGAVTITTPTALSGALTETSGTLAVTASSSESGPVALEVGVISIATGETFSLAGAVSFGVNDHAGPTLLGPGTLHTSGAVSVAAQTGYDYIDLYVAGDGAWSNSGDVTDAWQIIFGNGYAQSNVFDLINQAGGVFDLTTDYAAINEDNSDTASFNNAGLLEKTGGTATSTIETAITQTSTGTIAVTSGELEFTDGGSLAGHITTSGTSGLALEGGSFTFASASVAADLLIDGGAVTITTPTALSGALTETSGALAVTASSSESGPAALEAGVISIATGETFSLAGAVSFGVNNHAGPTLLGPGTLHTSGAVSVAAQTGYDYIDLYVAGDGAWSNSGDVTDAGQIIFGNGYAQSNVFDLINQAGGVFDLTTDYAAINEDNSDTASFNNAGLLEKTGGTATSTIETAITQASTGTIAVTSGTLEFTDGGSLAGHITTSGTGILAMANGSFTLASASVAADLLIDGGAVTITTPTALSGALTETSGTLAVTASSSESGPVALEVGVISIATGETFSLAGAVSFGVNDHAGPTLLGPGTLHTSGAVSVAAQTGYDYIDLYVAGDGAWSNSGDVTDAGQIIFGNGYAQSNVFDLINQAGGVFDLTTDYAAINEDNSDTASFNNAGLLEKTGGTATSTIETAITQTSTGTIAVTSGELEFTDGGSLAGHITTSGTSGLALEGGSFTFASASVAADLLIDGGAVTITTPTALSGALTETSGALAVTASSSESGPAALEAGVISIATGETFSLAGAVSFGVNNHAGPTLLGPGTLHTSGAVSVAAQTGYDYIDLYVAGDGAWSNSGDVTDAGQIIFGNGYAQSNVFDLINQAGGVFDLTTDYAAINEDNSDTASFNNAGLLEKTGGTATSTIETAITQTSTGTIAVTSGTLSLSGGLSNLVGNTLSLGSYIASAGATLQLANNLTISTDAANITLRGTNSVIESLDTANNTEVTLDETLGSIGSSGALYVLGGRNFTALANSGNFADSGLLDIGGGTFTATSIALSGTGTIAGFGIVDAALTRSGKLQATGGTLDLSSDTIGFLTSTTLTSGNALEADAAATLKLSNNKTITVDSGVITLSGTNSVIESLNTGTSTEIVIDTTLDDVTAGGVFNVLAGRNFTATANAGSFTNAGKISLGGGTFTATRLTEATGALLTGFGTVAGPISNAGTITASGGTLALTGSLSGAGTLSAAAGATLKLSLGGPFSEPVTGAGTLELSGTTAYTLAGTLAVGTVKIDAGTTLSGSGTIQGNLADAGAVTAATGTLGIGGTVSGAGTLSAASGAVLDLKGGGTFSGALSGAGKIQIDSALTLNAGTSLSATSVLDNANVTLGSGAAITNAAAHTYTIAAASGTTITVGGAGTFTNDGTLAATGAGTVDIDTTFINAASVSVGSGKMDFLSAVSGSGTVGIASGATAEFAAGAAATQHLSFLASAGELSLGSPASFLGTISGFTGADKIDLLNTAATKLSYSGNQLTVLNGTTTVATLNFSGAYSLNNFVLGSDNSGGSLITWQS